MCAVVGFSLANEKGRSLDNFQMKRLVSLDLTNSRYLIFAKVVLDNADGDAQNAEAQLRRQQGDQFEKLDATTVRLAGSGDDDRTEVSLQVGIQFDSATTVDLACATFRGNASQAQLAAIQLDFLNEEPSG
jgi:hypothetical protein